MRDLHTNILTSYDVHLPWFGVLLAFAICILLFIPIGIVMAIANQQISIYLICQLVCGALFPGRPVANMVFISFGYVRPPILTHTTTSQPIPAADHPPDNFNPSPQILLRPQTRPLHAHPAPPPLHPATRLHHPRLPHSNLRPQLVPDLNPGHLHPRRPIRLHLPHRPRPLQRLHPLGCRWPVPLLRARRPLPASRLGLPARLHRANRSMAVRSPHATRIQLAPHQPPRRLRRPKLDPAGHRSELQRLGCRVRGVQLRDQEAETGVVEKVYDDAECGVGCGSGVWSHGCVLWVCVSGGIGGVELVGDGGV